MRIALGVEYDGQAYAGWQWQTGRQTVQAVVEAALCRVANRDVRVVCAGRTDAGVHALEQVIHFDTDVARPDRAWLTGTNSNLPDDVRILWAKPVPDAFHARCSAIARSYRYVVLNRPMKSALMRHQVTWFPYPLDVSRMQEASVCLIGHHDFSSFRAKGCQSNSPRRFLHFIRIERQADRVVLDLAANAFLHHMVRNIVGLLLEIGAGKQPPGWARQVLLARDRSQGGVTAPADGLYLSGVCYPESFAIPRAPIFEWLPADARRHDPGDSASTPPACQGQNLTARQV